ncbi:allantoate amidohydrolase [Nocardioides ferulae]|uniref:allantoate amidohydrolase n=1 Tax=Nocardioides ferulae TaxID=2340821 RepID=UPI000EB30C22|nr:allantoate amidohydrolase [Nocardioides ferulae]
MPDDFERMWRDLEPVGRSAATGGYFRQPWTSPERELHDWFLAQARARDLEVTGDELGNLVAWWRPAGALPASASPGVVTGSHLDSVLDGGAYDGPLGVVSALAAVDLLRARGFVPRRPLGVAVFVEEEGSRFGMPCLGSRYATGALGWRELSGLRDRDGVPLPDAVGAATAEALEAQEQAGPAVRLSRLRDQVGVFVELHVEQGRALVDRNAAVGVGSGIWPHGRWRFEFTGRADHAGTTRMEDRADPMLTFAMTALAANKQARLAGQRATFGRVEAVPNGTNVVPSSVTGWLDARAEDADALATLVEAVRTQAAARAERDGTSLSIAAESHSPAVWFDPRLVERVAAEHEGGDWPVLPTAAGHDAGILAAAGIPSVMLFVRNPTGVSHAPGEHAEVPDCLVGVSALADTLERLASVEATG